MKFTSLECFSEKYFLVAEEAGRSSEEIEKSVAKELFGIDPSARIVFLYPTLSADFGIRMYVGKSVIEPPYAVGAAVASAYLRSVCGIPLSDFEFQTPFGNKSVSCRNEEIETKLEKCKHILTKTAQMTDGSTVNYTEVTMGEVYAALRRELPIDGNSDSLGALICQKTGARAAVFTDPDGRIFPYAEAGYSSLGGLCAGAVAYLAECHAGGRGERAYSLCGSRAIFSLCGGVSVRCSPRLLWRGEL